MNNKKTRIEKIMSDQYYIWQCLRAYNEIIKSGDCNDCANKNNCKYAPAPGELVRYNCPFYKKED